MAVAVYQAAVDIATVIMLPVRVHFNKIFTQFLDNIAGLFMQAAASDNITGIMKSNRFVIFFPNLYFTLFENVIVKFNIRAPN